jgi:hypothetical protein
MHDCNPATVLEDKDCKLHWEGKTVMKFGLQYHVLVNARFTVVGNDGVKNTAAI